MFKDILKSLLVAAILALAGLAANLTLDNAALKSDIAFLKSERFHDRERIDRLVERAVYYHGEEERTK
jgi:hypothetical protein